MNGTVDDDLRALLEVQIGSTPNGPESTVLVWVDTAFNGGVVLPRREIQRLGLKEYSSTPATLIVATKPHGFAAGERLSEEQGGKRATSIPASSAAG